MLKQQIIVVQITKDKKCQFIISGSLHWIHNIYSYRLCHCFILKLRLPAKQDKMVSKLE